MKKLNEFDTIRWWTQEINYDIITKRLADIIKGLVLMILFENSVYPHVAVIWKTPDQLPTSGSSGHDGKEGEVRPMDVLNPVAASERIEEVCQAGDEAVSSAFCSLESLEGETLVGEILKRGKAAVRLSDLWDSFLAQGLNGQRMVQKSGKDFFYREVDDVKDKVKLLANVVDLESVLECFETDANAKIEQNPWRIVYQDKDGSEQIYYLEMGGDFLARMKKMQKALPPKPDIHPEADVVSNEDFFTKNLSVFHSLSYFTGDTAKKNMRVQGLITAADNASDAIEKIRLLREARDLVDKNNYRLQFEITSRLVDCEVDPESKEIWMQNQNTLSKYYDSAMEEAHSYIAEGLHLNAMRIYHDNYEPEKMEELFRDHFASDDGLIFLSEEDPRGNPEDMNDSLRLIFERSASSLLEKGNFSRAAELYAHAGDYDNARESYAKAIEEAQNQGNGDLEYSYQAALDRLDS